MSEDSDPPPPTPSHIPSRGRARPSMGGSGLFSTPQTSQIPVSPTTEEEPEISEMIQQVTTQIPPPSNNQITPTAPITEIHPTILNSFLQIGTRIHMDSLIRSHGGILAQLDPESPGIVHMTKRNTILSNIVLDDIISSHIGMNSSSDAPENHSLIFVLLAQHSLNNPGKAAAILAHCPWTLASSSHEDSFVLDANNIGLGRIAIIDDGTQDSMISEIKEAVTQIGGPAIIIRNKFILGFGSNLETVSSNLTRLEHEMQRQYLNS